MKTEIILFEFPFFKSTQGCFQDGVGTQMIRWASRSSSLPFKPVLLGSCDLQKKTWEDKDRTDRLSFVAWMLNFEFLCLNHTNPISQ